LLHIFCTTSLSPLQPPSCRTWLLLPNLEDAAVADFLPQLLDDASRKGFDVYADVQDLRPMFRYFNWHTLDIFNRFNNFAFFRILDNDTAIWASEKLTRQLSSIGDEPKDEDRPQVISPQTLASLELASSEAISDGFIGQDRCPFYRTPPIKDAAIVPSRLFGLSRGPTRTQVPRFVPRPDKDADFPADVNALLAPLGFRRFQANESAVPR
jgi:hypothetical protein